MKNIKRSTLILFAILACLCAAIPVSAKPSASTVKNAYDKYKSKKGISCSLYVDIDKNGIVDMIYTRNGALGVCSYSSSKKKVVKVKEVAGTGKAPSKVYYNTSKHYFGWCTGSTGGGDYYIYKLKGTTATRKIHLKWRNQKGGGPYNKLNGKTISDAEFDKQKNKIWNYKSIQF